MFSFLSNSIIAFYKFSSFYLCFKTFFQLSLVFRPIFVKKMKLGRLLWVFIQGKREIIREKEKTRESISLKSQNKCFHQGKKIRYRRKKDFLPKDIFCSETQNLCSKTLNIYSESRNISSRSWNIKNSSEKKDFLLKVKTKRAKGRNKKS